MATYSTQQTSAQETYDRTNTIAAGGNFNVSGNVFGLRIGADNTTLNINDSVVLSGPGYNEIYPCSSAVVFGDLTYDSNDEFNALYNAIVVFSGDRELVISNTSGGNGENSVVYGIVGNSLTFGTVLNPNVGANVSFTASATVPVSAGNTTTEAAAIRNMPTAGSSDPGIRFLGDLSAAFTVSAISGGIENAAFLPQFKNADASAHGIFSEAGGGVSIGGSFNGSFDIVAKSGLISSNIQNNNNHSSAYAAAFSLANDFGKSSDLNIGANLSGRIHVLAETGIQNVYENANGGSAAYGIRCRNLQVGGDFSSVFQVQSRIGDVTASRATSGRGFTSAARGTVCRTLMIAGNLNVQGSVSAAGDNVIAGPSSAVAEAIGLDITTFDLRGNDTSSLSVSANSASLSTESYGNYDVSASSVTFSSFNQYKVGGNSSGTLSSTAVSGNLSVSVNNSSYSANATATAYAVVNNNGLSDFQGVYEKDLIAEARAGMISVNSGTSVADAAAAGLNMENSRLIFHSSVNNTIEILAQGGQILGAAEPSYGFSSAVAEAAAMQGEYSLTFHGAVTADWNVIARGGTAYGAGAPVEAYSSAFGLDFAYLNGSGVLGGTISVTAQGGWSSTTSGQTTRRDNGIATGIYVSNRLAEDDYSGGAFTIAGNIIANGEQYANGIVAGAMNLTVSGTVFAGKYNISVSATAEELNAATAELEALLLNADANITVLKDAVLNAQGYAIYAGTMTPGTSMTYSAGTSDDVLTLNSNARVFGNIDLTGGTNTLTFADNAFFSGDLYASGGSMKVNYSIQNTENGHLFVSSDNVELLASSSATISVDISNAAAGTYYLLESPNLSAIAGQRFSVVWQGEEKQMTIGSQSVFSDTMRASLQFAGESGTSLALVVEDLTDRIKPVLSSEPISAYLDGNDLYFVWSPATDNIGVTSYIVEWNGQEAVVESTGCCISNIAAGMEYTIRYCAVDAAGNRSDWSQPFAYAVPVAPPEKDTVSPVLSSNSAASIRYEGTQAIITWEAASDNVGVAGYWVEFDGQLYQTSTPYLQLEIGYGTHTVRYYAYDTTGNISDWSVAVSSELPAPPEKDTVSPVLSSNSAASIRYEGTQAIITWEAAADNVGVAGYWMEFDGQLYQTSTPYLQLETDYGTHTVRYYAYDATGNVSDWSAAVSSELPAPEPPAIGPDLTKDLSVSVTNKSYKAKFSWGKAALEKGEKLQGYEVVLDGVSLGYVKSTSYSTKTPLSVGTHTVMVRAVNQEGEAGSWYEESFVLQDVTAPQGKMKLSTNFFQDGAGVPMVDLSWDPATDNVGVTKYVVSYGSGKEMISTETTGTSLRISNVAGKMTFQVSAYDAAGNQSKVSRKTQSVPDLVAPDTVQNLRAEVDKKKYKATLSWDAALDNGGTAKAAGYYVTYGKEADFSDGTMKKSSRTSLSVSGLEANTTYYYKVVAYDKAGNESAVGQTASFYVKDLAAPSGKMKVVAEAKVENGQQVVDLRWNAAEDNIGVTKYLVEYGTGRNLIAYETTETGFRLPGTVAGKLTVQIRAYDAAGNESRISKSTVTIADKIAPDVVQNLNCVQEESKYKATLTWDESLDNGGTSKASGYYVTYATNADFSDAVTKKTSKTTLTLSKLQAGTTYYYKVTAYDKAKNESASSALSSFYVKDVTSPSKPSMQVKEVSDNVYLVTWKTPKDNVGIAGYEVLCENAAGETVHSWQTAESSVNLTLPNAGSYTFRLSAYDASGNVSSEAVKKINVKNDLLLSYSSASDLNLNFGRETERSLGLAAV